MDVNKIAKVAHEVNRAFCISNGDDSQSSWENAEDWKKSSTFTGVEFLIDNPDATPITTHENWVKDKVDYGWKYGTKKDVDLKLHPCIIPYDDLPVMQKSKDYIFSAVVKTLADM